MPAKIHHNTRDEVTEAIAGAVQIVGELEVPDDLREAAFTKAVELLAGAQIFYTETDAIRAGASGGGLGANGLAL